MPVDTIKTTKMADAIPETGSKRSCSSDSDELPLHKKQTERQTRARQNTGESNSDDITTGSGIPEFDIDSDVFRNETPIENMTVGEITKIVTTIITDRPFFSSLADLISKHVAKTLTKSIEATCKKCIKPYADKIDEQDRVIDSLSSRVSVLEQELEEQQQYSRRTSLRFNSVKLPTNENGDITYPINTDALVMNICKDNLEQPITIDDLGRTHTIGKIKEGKASIIARFISYRKRHLVYSNKRKLKSHPDGTFISENLTRQRFQVVRKLDFFRKKGDINAYWTQDGRIIVKPAEGSDRREFKIITSEADIFYKLHLDPSIVKLRHN